MAENRMVVTIHLDDEVKAALDEAAARHRELKRENDLLKSACAALVDLIQSALHQSDDLPWPFIKETMGKQFSAIMDTIEQAQQESRQ